MFSLGVALVLLAAPAVDSPEYKEQLTEGLRRHDGGDYAGAMKVYRSMLATWPHEPLIVYELSLSMNAAGTSPDELITFVESELKVMKKPNAELYSMLGSLWDAKRELAKGETWFRKGVAAFPKSGELRFNLGINLAMQRKNAEAEKELLRCAEAEPNRPGVWRTLSILCLDLNRLTDAILTKMRFVLLESRSERGQAAARSLEELLRRSVRVDGKQVTINASNKDDMVVGLLMAASVTKDDLNESEQLVDAMGGLVAFAAEDPKRPLFKSASSMFVEAKKAGVLEAALWELRRAASDPAADTWFSKHRKEAEAFDEFMRPVREKARRASPP
jgi:tetratricopeptide (TPR) repeat protein